MADRFRKKPVVIEAMQVPPQNDMENWGKLSVFLGTGDHWQVRDRGRKLQITTLEGKMLADNGDWIIRGVKGELYPCKPGIFAVTYEAERAPEPEGTRTDTGQLGEAMTEILLMLMEERLLAATSGQHELFERLGKMTWLAERAIGREDAGSPAERQEPSKLHNAGSSPASPSTFVAESPSSASEQALAHSSFVGDAIKPEKGGAH